MSSRRTVLLIVLWIAGAASGCSRSEPTLTRGELFALDRGDPVQQALRSPARAVALYWPEPGCFGCQAAARSALELAATAGGGIRVLTVIPAQDGRPVAAPDLPGEVVELPPESYARQVATLSVPRLEVWSDAGRELLLLRRLPPVLEAAALADEIRSCLSFTSSTDSPRKDASS